MQQCCLEAALLQEVLHAKCLSSACEMVVPDVMEKLLCLLCLAQITDGAWKQLCKGIEMMMMMMMMMICMFLHFRVFFLSLPMMLMCGQQ
jgi:hypothetical protein